MRGIIGKKIGMSSIFDEQGKNWPCTIIEAGPCVITQVKTDDTDKYNAHQLAFEDKKEKSTTAALKGHFKKANTAPKRKVVEIRDFELDKKVGDVVTADIFQENEYVNVVGTSKGKGFQGVVKRHGFSGVGGRTHGQHNRERAPGSLGASSFPSKVVKGIRMAGRTGGKRITTKGIKILKVVPEKNLLLLSGVVPGHKGAYVIIKNSK